MKKRVILLIYLLLVSYLNVGFVGFAPVSASGNVVFSDDFNDNSLDTSEWTEDVVGSGNSYTEANGEAKFVVYGHQGWDYGHAVLRSRGIHLNNWSSITLSGRWKFTNPGTAEMLVRVEDLNSSNFVGIHYVSWPSEQVSYRYYGNSVNEARTIPRNYATFKVVIHKDRFEFWESGALVKTIYTTSMANATDFQVVIGGWDYSAYYSHVYFDDIAVEYTLETPPENPLSITIVSPEEGTYSTTTIDLNVTANKPVDEWRYSLNGGKNITFTPNTTIEAQEGENSLEVYALAGDESVMAQVNFYVEVKDTTPPGTVRNLRHEVGSDYILWTWENPDDKDFDEALVYIDGEFEGGTADGEWLLDGLSPGETHTIGILTNDTSGNVNTTWVNDTATTPSPSETVYVNESGWWYEGGTFNPSETPLQSGIDAASENGTVIVLHGNYGESVEIDKPLMLRSSGLAVIEGDGSELDEGVKPVVYVGSDNVTLRDLTIVSSISNIGIWLDGVHNCTFEGSNVTITEASEDFRYGVYLSYGGGNTVRNNGISVFGSQGVGVYVYEEEGRSGVYGNTVTVNGDSADGIEVFYTSADVHGNSLQISGIGENSGYALYLYLAGNSGVEDNDVATSLNEANAWAITVVEEFSGTLSGNQINDLSVEIRCPGDCMVRGVGESERPAPPEGYSDIGEFIEASADTWLYLTFHYDDFTLEGLKEDSLGIWRFSEGWTLDGVSDPSLDTVENTVGANLTQFSIFAPLAQAEEDTTPPVLTLVEPTPEDGSLLGDSIVTINVTANENLTSAFLEFDGVNHTMSGSGREWSYTLSVPDGSHSFRVYGQDLAGNNGTSEERSFEVDTQAPSYSSVGQDKEDIPQGETLHVYALWSDPHLEEALLHTNISGSWEVLDGFSFEGTSGWSNFSISADEPGLYCWYIEGLDELEHSNETPVHCFEVHSPPEVVSYSPESPVESYVGDSVTFTVTANGVVNVTWYVGEDEVKSEENVQTSSYTGSMPVEGEYSVYVVIENAYGSLTHYWTWYVYERPGFVISFADPTPEDGAMLNVRSVTINVTSSLDLDNATLEWNGANESMSGSGRSWWLTKENLPDGDYAFRVYGSADGVTNRTEERTIEIDATPPELLESGQSADLLRVGESVTLFARWSDVHLESAVLWSNTTFTDGVFIWEETPLEIADGWSNWTVSITEEMAGKTFCWYMVANDTFGNEEQSDELCFSVEERLRITSFSPEGEEATYPPDGSAAFSIALNQIANVTWFVNGTEVLNREGNSSTYINSTLVVGLWNVSVVASNENGEVSHWWLMRVEEADTTPPALWFVEPTPHNGSVLNDSRVIIAASSSEDLREATLYVDNVAYEMEGSNRSWSAEISLTDGTHVLRVQGIDLAGNSGSTESRELVVDTTHPEIAFGLQTPKNGSFVNTTAIQFVVSSSENLSSAVLVLDGESYEMTGGGTEWTLELTLPEGLHTFHAEGRDLAGNPGSTGWRSFTVDTTPPEIAFVPPTPENGSSLGTGDVTFSLNSSEPLKSATLHLDGSTYDMVQNGDLWTLHLTLGDGDHTFYVTVRDRAENLGMSGISSFEIDTTPPVLELVSPTPENGSFVNRTTITVETKANENLSSAILEFDGVDYTMGGSGTKWSITIEASEGSHSFLVYGFDEAGNRGFTERRSFVIDVTPPTLKLIGSTPRAGSILNRSAVEFEITSSEAISSAVLVLDGKEYVMEGSGESWRVSLSVEDGHHEFYVVGKDLAGNEGKSEERPFTVDTAPPEIEFKPPTPTNGSVVNTEEVLVRVTSNEILKAAFLELDGVNHTMTNYGADWRCSIAVSEGDHRIKVYAIDLAGNLGGSGILNFSVDLTPPSAAFIAPTPANGSLTSSNIAEFRVVSSEGLSKAVLHLDGETYPMERHDPYWTATLTLSDGIHVFWAEVTDEAGNVGFTEGRTFTVDTTPPTLTFVPPTPENGSLLGAYVYKFAVNASENLASAVLELDGANVTLFGSGMHWESGWRYILNDGFHRFRVYGTDRAGNLGISELHVFEVDITKPSVGEGFVNLTITSSTGDVIHAKAERKSGAGTVLNATDAHPGLYTVDFNPNANTPQEGWYRLETGPYESGVPFLIPFNTSEEAYVIYSIEVADATGNRGYHKYIYLTVEDTTPPGGMGYFDVSTYVGGAIVSWINPNDEDFDHTELWVNGSLVGNFTGEPGSGMEQAVSLTPGGTYNVSVVPVDRYGNRGVPSWRVVTIPYPDLSKASYVLPTPEDGMELPANTSNVTVKVSSPERIASCRIVWDGDSYNVPVEHRFVRYIDEKGRMHSKLVYTCEKTFSGHLNGGHYFYALVYDGYGNSRTLEVRHINVQWPCFEDCSLEVTSPREKSNVMSLLVPINFTMVGNALPEGYALTIGGLDYKESFLPNISHTWVGDELKITGSYVFDMRPLLEKLGKLLESGEPLRLTITAEGRCGRKVRGETVFTLCKGNRPPEMKVNLHTNYRPDESVVPEIRVNDPDGNLEGLYISINGGPYVRYTEGTDVSENLTPYAGNIVRIKAVDLCGAETVETFKVEVSGPPVSGDWVVNGSQACYGMEYTVNGSILITENGSLTLKNCRIHVLGKGVDVNGTFRVLGGSFVEGLSLSLRGTGGTLDVEDSALGGFKNGEFTGTVSTLNSHLIGNFAFTSSEVSLEGSEIEGGATVSGSLTVEGSTFHSGAGLRYLRNGLPGESLSVINSTFVDGDRGIEVIGDLSDWHWTLRDLEVENNRGCGLYFEDPSYSYATQTVKGAVVGNNGKGVCIRNARLRFENSVVESNDDANFDLDLGTNWLCLVSSNVTGSRYAFLAKNTGGIEMWDTNVSGSVSPYPTYLIVHVSGGKRTSFENGDAGHFYAYVDGELVVKSYHLQDGKIEVHPGGTLRVEDTDGIPATNPLDDDASVLKKMTISGEAGSEESTLLLLNSKLEDTTVESYSKEVLVRGCHIEGGSLAFNTNLFWSQEDTETLNEVIGEGSEWFYSTSMPAEDWIYTTSTAGMEASDGPFYADSSRSHFTGGTEVGKFTDLYLKKVVTLDTLPAQAWLNYYAVSGVEVYINGRKVVDELDHRAQLSYAYGWGGGVITAHPLMDVIDVGGYLRRGENVIAVHVRSPTHYPYLQLGAFKATLHVVEGMAGLTDSVVRAPITGAAARLIVARDEVDSNITFTYYARVRISDSTLHGGISVAGNLELLRSEVIGSESGQGIHLGAVFNALVNESTVRGFSQGIYAQPGRRGTSTLGIYSSRISGNGVGVHARGINMTVRSSYIMHNSEGIDLSHVEGRVEDSLIFDNGVGILVHPYVGGGLLVDHDTVVGNDVGLLVKDGNGEGVAITNSLIQNNDLGLLVNGSASIIAMNNSIVNTRGVHVVRNSGYTVLKRTDWGGHEPVLVENYTGGTMYTVDGKESEDYDILVESGTLTLGDIVETGSGWGSSLLGAFLSVYPMNGDEVKGVVTLAGSASSRSKIVKVNYTLVWNGTEELIGEATLNSHEYRDYVTFDSLARNLTGVGYLKFTAEDADGTSVSAVRKVYFGNAHIDIVSVSVNHPTAVYVYRRYHEGEKETSMPYDERFANVTVTLRNTGNLTGVVKVELVLPGYIERHTGRVSLLVAVPGGMSGEFHALIPITVYDPITLKWDPLPDELPSNHKIPMDVKLYDLDGIVRDEASKEIGFDLGPVFKIESYSAYPYTRQFCQNEPGHCHVKEFSEGTTYTYDGDGDDDLEAAESHHFNLDIRNVGDKTAYIKLVDVRDQIPERDPNAHYKFLRMMSVAIEEENSVYTLDVESANLTGLAPPGRLKWIWGAWMPWWHDDPPKWIPPVNFSGDYMTSVAVNYVPYENGQPSDWIYTTYSINYEKTPVKALNKTFAPFSESLGPVQIDVLGINGNKTYMRLRNTDENIYYSYYAEGAYDMSPEGYVWYHVIPPGFEFKAIVDQSREPGTVIPHYRVNAGVDYSLLFNELQLAAIATEGALKVYDIDVPVETIVMAIAKSGLKIGNIVGNIDFPDDQTIEEYSKSSSAVQVNAMLSADNTTIVPLTLNDFARWEEDYGMDQNYYYNLTHLSEIPLDAKVNVLTTLAKAIITDEELQTVFIETVLEVVDNDVLNDIYKNVQEMKEPPDPGDEVEENLNDMRDDINEMLVEYLKEEIKKQKSFQELDPKEQKKALKKSGKSIAAAIETFEKMGEWAFYNIYAVMTKPSPMQIQVLDPPANYTVEAEKMDTVVLLGGEGGNLDGWGNVSLTFGNPDVYRAEYIVPTPATRVGPLFNGTFERMGLEIHGRRDGEMKGTVTVRITPDARNASMVFAFFRNGAFARAFIGAYMTRIESFNVRIENNTVLIIAEGELAALPEDKEVHITLNVGRILTNATIVRKGHYGVVELKPAFGIDPSKVETSLGGNATISEDSTGSGVIIVASSGNETIEPPEIAVSPIELYIGGAIGIETSKPCLVSWTLGNRTGEGALVPTGDLEPGNYTLGVICTYGNLTVRREFSMRVLKRPIVERKASGDVVSGRGGEWIRVITNTDLYRLYFIPASSVSGTVVVRQSPGGVENYLTYALFNVTHPENWSLRNVTLRFRVSKNWLAENNVSVDKVLLLRWEGEWVEYRPEFEYEDLRYVYYKVSVPGLSLFAVAEKIEAPSPGTNGTSETETTITPGPTGTTSSSPSPPSASGGSNLPYYALAIAVLVLIGLYLYRKR
ncbi:hypothetical protein A3L09_05160 [Thermococcus profundus]|uniref:Uncharacterized protein n=1 Tax=Thermococcus profundus TaxID=49899 RepID=A0A2Z2MA95_THEPR|nr:PGF-pre-PGF domain-containing protein [Thermococcus profundus]ASJ02686.1 hypothetical protein A3L09_05160 [Thermococcus profundus]